MSHFTNANCTDCAAAVEHPEIGYFNTRCIACGVRHYHIAGPSKAAQDQVLAMIGRNAGESVRQEVIDALKSIKEAANAT